ncbi:MAG: membrane dipeptidase [Clostridia bacterium]|nr:membrane dipeptidase [Clostridia bacterium]
MNLLDLHCDTALELYKRNLPFKNNVLSVTLNSSDCFHKWVQTFAIWINDNAENPFVLYKNILNHIKNKLRNKPLNLTPIFAVEGGWVLENDIDRLEIIKKDGIKMLTLTWNGENPIGGGCKSDKGLTDFGREVIKKLNTLKIATDLSHLNTKTFFKALEIADFPLASHSNCFEICQHPRNLSLEQFKLITEKGGIIGLTFYPPFLGGDVFEKIYQNIFVLCDKNLENHIAIGTDFDGAQMDKKLQKTSDVPYLYHYLEKRGLKKTLLDKIFFENGYKFIAKL